jgi:hypothetical protein
MNVLLAIGFLSHCSQTVAAQRESGGLDLLRATALTPPGLLAGLCTGVYMRAVLLLLAQLPVAIFCLSLRDLSLSTIFGFYLLALAFLFFLAAFGLYWSVVSTTAWRASRNAFLAFPALYLIPTYLSGALARSAPPWTVEYIFWMGGQNLGNAFVELFDKGRFPAASMALHLVLGFLFFWRAARRFEENCESEESVAAIISPAPEYGPSPRKPRLTANPLAWKEFHFAASGQSSVQRRWLLYPFIAGFLALASDRVGSALLIVGGFGLLVDVPRTLSRMLGAEVRDLTLVDLAILPLSPWRIVAGKLRGLVPILLPALVPALAGALLTALPFDSSNAAPNAMLAIAYLTGQEVLLLTLAIFLSLSQPLNAYATSVVVVLVLNSAGLGLMFEFGSFPPGINLLIVSLIAVVSITVMVRAFPAAFYRAAAR